MAKFVKPIECRKPNDLSSNETKCLKLVDDRWLTDVCTIECMRGRWLKLMHRELHDRLKKSNLIPLC